MCFCDSVADDVICTDDQQSDIILATSQFVLVLAYCEFAVWLLVRSSVCVKLVSVDRHNYESS